jgi:hypothetical protein
VAEAHLTCVNSDAGASTQTEQLLDFLSIVSKLRVLSVILVLNPVHSPFSELIKSLSRDGVNIEGICIGNRIYWTLDHKDELEAIIAHRRSEAYKQNFNRNTSREIKV